MPHNEQAVQQWASTVMKSPYWEDVKNMVRQRLVTELIEAAHEGNQHDIQMISCMLSVLDDVVRGIGALRVDTNVSRKFFETVIDDAE